MDRRSPPFLISLNAAGYRRKMHSVAYEGAPMGSDVERFPSTSSVDPRRIRIGTTTCLFPRALDRVLASGSACEPYF